MSTPIARALREHGDALAAIIDTLAQVEPECWTRPWSPGKWSAEQIAQHLILTYEGSITDLEGGPPARPRVGPTWQKVFRVFLLPHILFHRSFPLRVRAPREWRPGDEGEESVTAVARLSDVAQRFEDAAARAHEAGRSLRHPYFGPVDALRALRLAAVHLEHHRRQLLRCLAPGRVASPAG